MYKQEKRGIEIKLKRKKLMPTHTFSLLYWKQIADASYIFILNSQKWEQQMEKREGWPLWERLSVRSEQMLGGSGGMPPPPPKIFDKMAYFWCIQIFGRHLKADFQPTTECFFFNKMYRFTDLHRSQEVSNWPENRGKLCNHGEFSSLNSTLNFFFIHI